MSDIVPVKFLSIEEAIEVVRGLGFHTSEIRMRRMARERELPFFKDGRRLYISKEELLKYYNKRQDKALRA